MERKFFSDLKSFEESLESEAKLITEAIGDVIYIVKNNESNDALSLINKRFLVIAREDIETESKCNFESYLIEVGIRSDEYTYDKTVLYENIDYFKESFKNGLSPYKALLFLHDFLNG